MEMYTGPEQRITETYMIPATGSNPPLAYLPQLEEIDYMGNEVAPEFIFDQGLYYPAANYYGYYCTGFESPGDWDDQNRFVGLDGQDLHYSGLQTESLPYVYYTPSYGYAQSPYNPYNPYIPGAVIGLDGSYIGTEQYVTNPTYQPQVPSPAYIPIVAQPSADAAPSSTHEPSPFVTGASVASRYALGGLKRTPLVSTNMASNSQRPTAVNPHSDTSHSSQIVAKPSEGPIVNTPTNKMSSMQEVPLGSAAQVVQVKSSSGSAQATDEISHGRVYSVQNPLRVTIPSSEGFTHYGSNARGWASVDKFRPRLQSNGVLSNPTGGTEVLGEQNKGPRTGMSRSQWVSSAADGVRVTKLDATNGQWSITIDANNYNRADFQVNYPIAKFFVIKSYSEDDVHKSIKYNVWSSTPNGNKRLHSAYEDAQKISAGHPRNCSIFLFFSVNASGQFCGVAEMIGPVDFNKDMDFWHQDKWTGSFPVKWHMIKDVPNISFRHIILENNENKPVTNSRDTQEIPYLPGINMLNIFKSTPLKTCILDDFKFYEDRERIMQEEKARLNGRSYDRSQFLPVNFPVNKTNSAVSQTRTSDEKQSNEAVDDAPNTGGKQLDTTNQLLKGGAKQVNGLSYQCKKADGKQHNGTVEQSLSHGGKSPSTAINQPSKADGKPTNGAVHLLKPDEKLLNSAIDHSQRADGDPPNVSVGQSPQTDGNQSKPKDLITTGAQIVKVGRNAIKTKHPKNMIEKHLIADGNDLRGITDQHSKADRKDHKSAGDQLRKAGGNSSSHKNPTIDEKVAMKKDPIQLSSDKKDAAHGPTLDAPAVNAEKDEASSVGTMVTDVTVGSMRIKVKGHVEPSAGIITVGTIPIEPKGLKVNKRGVLSGSNQHQKKV